MENNNTNQIITYINNQIKVKCVHLEVLMVDKKSSIKTLIDLEKQEISKITITILCIYLNPDNKGKKNKEMCKIIETQLRNQYEESTIERQLIPDLKKIINKIFPDINIRSVSFHIVIEDLKQHYNSQLIQSRKKINKYYIPYILNTEYIEYNKFIEKLGKTIEKYGIKILNKLSDTRSDRIENIRNCDIFSIILSPQLIEDEKGQERIAKELDLAIKLNKENINSGQDKPKIIFVCKDIHSLSNISLLRKDFDTESMLKNLKVEDFQEDIISIHLEENDIIIDDIYKLLEKILPRITFVEDLDNWNEFPWFKASKKPYEEEFFPIPSERLPFEEIEKRIEIYNMNNSKEWYELYAIWHENVDENNLDKTEQADKLSSNIIGMSYACIHLLSGWIFGNYFAISSPYRSEKRCDFFYRNIQEKVKNKIEVNKLKGMVFEIELIDLNFLATVADLETNIVGSDKEDNFIIQFRRFRRLNWFLQRKNTYIILNKQGNPFPYVQPGMDAPPKDNDTELILMVELLDGNLKNEENILIEKILNFLYNHLFLSGSNDRAEGYQENVEQVKRSVYDKFQKLERCILGKMEDISLINRRYDCTNLFLKLMSKARHENMMERLKLF